MSCQILKHEEGDFGGRLAVVIDEEKSKGASQATRAIIGEGSTANGGTSVPDRGGDRSVCAGKSADACGREGAFMSESDISGDAVGVPFEAK